jgi:hypothetical protein
MVAKKRGCVSSATELICSIGNSEKHELSTPIYSNNNKIQPLHPNIQQQQQDTTSVRVSV